MANIGLYYPYIQFKDETWLKLTALYWDRMARIVPSGFPLADSDGVRLLADTGFVIERPPRDDEMDAVAAEFERLIGRHADELAKRYSLMYRASWPLDSVTAATEPPSADPHLAYIYPTKMQPSLARTLVNAGLAEFGPSHPDIGLGLHPQLANVYMLTLARTAAKNTGYHPVTDETRNHVGMAACTLAALVEALLGKVEVASPIDRRSEAESLLLNMAFTAVMPVNLEHVPMEKIIEVRNTWSTERWQFQEGLKTILNGLGENLRGGIREESDASTRGTQKAIGARELGRGRRVVLTDDRCSCRSALSNASSRSGVVWSNSDISIGIVQVAQRPSRQAGRADEVACGVPRAAGAGTAAV